MKKGICEFAAQSARHLLPHTSLQLNVALGHGARAQGERGSSRIVIGVASGAPRIPQARRAHVVSKMTFNQLSVITRLLHAR